MNLTPYLVALTLLIAVSASPLTVGDKQDNFDDGNAVISKNENPRHRRSHSIYTYTFCLFNPITCWLAGIKFTEKPVVKTKPTTIRMSTAPPTVSIPETTKLERRTTQEPTPTTLRPTTPRPTPTTPRPNLTTPIPTPTIPTTQTPTTTPKTTQKPVTEPLYTLPPVTPSHTIKTWIPNNKPLSWDEAQKQCGISKLHLPILETGAEMTRIEGIWKKIDRSACGGNEFWIGLRKTCSLNFEWANGQMLSCNTKWSANVEAETGNCVTQSVTSDGKIEWHRRSCKDEYCFLCEMSS